jgi:Ni2+-binding GTPase involved in maturation of urease and hydrogenase
VDDLMAAKIPPQSSRFLGAGKTTLIRHMLPKRQGKKRIAVIINRFGDLGVGDILKGCGIRNLLERRHCQLSTVASALSPMILFRRWKLLDRR